jgi:poly-gamma-glutamate capsule biosynthesis protein CapA/YwtB (metallophosphatase superfamily)
MPDNEKWSIAIAGECMVTRPFAMHDEPEFTEVIDKLHDSDVTYAHIETNFGQFSEVEAPSRGDQVGSYFLTDPQVAHDLRWAGVDIASIANNHSFDFGKKGLFSTIKHMDEAGIKHAGTGRDLEEAREPSYLETKKGRVALVSVSSGNKSHEWASPPKASLPGRAGVNSLRSLTRFVVPEEEAEQLKKIGHALGIAREQGMNVEGSSGLLANALPGEFSLAMPTDQSTTGSNLWKVGDAFGIETSANKHDLAGNVRSIEEAATMADVVIVAHHFSISEGGRGNLPPKFVVEFAHAAIDAGADIFVGHGWHKTLGIEIYKGKPILYGLGNFFAQSEFVRRVPFDAYETWKHDVDKLQTLTPAAHPLHPGLNAGNETWWSSAVIQLVLENGVLTGLELHPVELGRDVSKEAPITRRVGSEERPLTDGRPYAATGENAARVLERYQRLSAELGTTVTISEDGVGRIAL